MEERTLFSTGLILALAAAIALIVSGHSNLAPAAGVIAGVAIVAFVISLVLEARAKRIDPQDDNRATVPLTSAAPSGGAWGDDLEHHDEISPHDLPIDHPGRHAAEEAADDRFTRTHLGVTRGNQ